MKSQPTEHPPIRPVWMDQWLECPETVPEGSCAETLEMVVAYIRILEANGGTDKMRLDWLEQDRDRVREIGYGSTVRWWIDEGMREFVRAVISNPRVAATPEVRA